MSYFLQNYTLTYTPLSPIHIGTGDSYEPTNYFIDDGTLYEFDTGGAFAALSETDRIELNKIVNARANEDMLKAVQRFFYDRRKALMPWAVNAIPVLNGVADYYDQRLGKSINRGVMAKLEIDRTAYNPITRQPVLFGSSIKGAIRTALLSHINDKHPLSRLDADKFILDDLDQGERRRREREQKLIFPKLNERLFEFKAGKFELDPMRLVQISDAKWSEREYLSAAQVVVSVNRKKELKRDKQGNEIFSQAEKNENLCKLLESISAWRYRAFSGQVNLQNFADLKRSEKVPSAKLLFKIEQIAKYCSKHYLPILKAEMKIMRERGFLDSEWDKNIQALLGKMADKLLSGQAFLIRVGRHSGAESVTIEGVRHIKIMKGNPEFQSQTKTLWLAASDPKQRTNLLPFGWLLVEIHPGDAPVNEWTELAELCQSQHGQARLWAEKQTEQKIRLTTEREAAERRRQLEETERQQRLAQEKEVERVRLAQHQADELRRANMMPEQLQIEALRQQLEQKQASKVREQIGGPLYGDLRKLIDQGVSWPNEYKLELLEVAKIVLEFIGASGNKKAKELLRTLQ
ncbi:MAG: type III-A CRISPR-associated RAMP protein Csm5 [Methylicorpusculum sp.]|uniref:type III-A CRISPR-associated RAMP protein Csm5 n=1 Tax=Methylicorpusculum sp. TaxID=2713644 RepID=UPI00271899B9|nr:type III-A CRISPR-associated RAMP protein Csm5 [Methylicorpusculum sp.]MDO8844631.1 type III-A CRISPR-associated RAMP protein Csm5 [Methylicorpusculum sp.]MDO8940717.1 type III-A CRISPR-associated RAMP protein Csm5 [Methylicorpusculum sp.]MDP2203776.1 type III-A CRISPR-associated RAMP protein Csm5 [Methylicorpusculum sp.]